MNEYEKELENEMNHILHGSQIKRLERIQRVHNYIVNKNGTTIDVLMKVFPNISRRTLTEYVKVLINDKKIKVGEFGKFVPYKSSGNKGV